MSAPETVRRLSGHILPRNALNFTHCHLDFKTFSRGETPGLLLTGAEKGRGSEMIKGFLPLKERGGRERSGEGERDGRGKEGRGGPATGGGDLVPRS